MMLACSVCFADDSWDCNNCGQKGISTAFCPYCGAKRDDTWVCNVCGVTGINTPFCPYCGTKRTGRVVWDCPKCGNKEISTPFCPICGTEMPIEAVDVGLWDCPACGVTKLTSNFCPNCGEKRIENCVEIDLAELTPIKKVDLAPVYYTKYGSYYHLLDGCSGMMNAEKHTLYEAYVSGKRECLNCNVVSYDWMTHDPIDYLWVDIHNTAHTTDECAEFASGLYRIISIKDVYKGVFTYCPVCGADNYYRAFNMAEKNDDENTEYLFEFEKSITVYYGVNSRYYHANKECQQMLDIKYEHNLYEALHVHSMKPCPTCTPIASDDEAELQMPTMSSNLNSKLSFEDYEKTITVYFADYSKYYHATSKCQNMTDEKCKHSLYDAVKIAGLLPCMTCNPISEKEAMVEYANKTNASNVSSSITVSKQDENAKQYPFKLDKEARVYHAITEVNISNNNRNLLKIAGYSYGNWEGFDGVNNETWIYFINENDQIVYYPVTICRGCTNIPHTIANGRNMDYADFTCIIDLSDLPDGKYKIGSANRFKVGNDYFLFGGTFGEACLVIANSVYAVNMD